MTTAIFAKNQQDIAALARACKAICSGAEQVRVAFLNGHPGKIFTQAHRAWLIQKTLTNV